MFFRAKRPIHPFRCLRLRLSRALAIHRRHLLMPTSGNRNKRNSVKACQTSCRFRYSNDTSLFVWFELGTSRSRKENEEGGECGDLSSHLLQPYRPPTVRSP
ncbi:hypothetical protein KC341_g49 [Hortaea werneckii]|nr:hypothetical protein KC341_g49 [Hortaea werneckii]